MTDARKLATELESLPLLNGLGPGLARRLVELGSDQSFEAGTVLIEEQKLGAECYILLDGTAEIVLPDGRVKQEGRGSVIGELALLDTNRRTATVTAATPIRALVVHGSAFHEVLRDYPQFETRIRASRA